MKSQVVDLKLMTIHNDNLAVKALRTLGFVISTPRILPPVSTFTHLNSINNQQPSFTTISSAEFTYTGYIIRNSFTGQGKLYMKAHNLTYEGEFKNHQFEGKGKLTMDVNVGQK